MTGIKHRQSSSSHQHPPPLLPKPRIVKLSWNKRFGTLRATPVRTRDSSGTASRTALDGWCTWVKSGRDFGNAAIWRDTPGLFLPTAIFTKACSSNPSDRVPVCTNGKTDVFTKDITKTMSDTDRDDSSIPVATNILVNTPTACGVDRDCLPLPMAVRTKENGRILNILVTAFCKTPNPARFIRDFGMRAKNMVLENPTTEYDCTILVNGRIMPTYEI
mmetsp:Transcript_20948/g.31591  ORF Transcript_20948/g.31591 Transcript_20948/m.31591 type:complete len:218 (+) Transcript_20948:766-1419(+)